jgi:pimeloyl-ACP methyl ester carboxylesterase
VQNPWAFYMFRHALYLILSLILAIEAHAAEDSAKPEIRWQRVELGPAPSTYPFALYSSKALDGDAGRIVQAIVVLHGLQRNGDDYYRAAYKLLMSSGAEPESTLLIAPNFLASADAAKFDLTGIPIWSTQGWIAGEDSLNGPPALSSLDVLDDLVARLAERKRFPALKHIVVVGHSGGAQIVQRYAVLNAADEKVRASGIELSYVVANPSSYLYFTNERPDGDSFRPYNTVWCPNYNDYRYGLDNMIRYGKWLEGMQLFRRYAARKVTYLLGSNDTDPRHPVLDKTCGAEAEGPSRNARGRAYIRYERYLAGSSIPLDHRAYEVIGVGHDQERMLSSQCAAARIFGTRQPNTAGATCQTLMSP